MLQQKKINLNGSKSTGTLQPKYRHTTLIMTVSYGSSIIRRTKCMYVVHSAAYKKT